MELWLAVLHHFTGHWFGNSAFTAYNFWEPLAGRAAVVALLRGFYYPVHRRLLDISSALFALVWALRRMPLLRDRPWRIAASFVLAHVLGGAEGALGGAVLERYLLPRPRLYISLSLFRFRRFRMRTRRLAFALHHSPCLIAANFVNSNLLFRFVGPLRFRELGRAPRRGAAASMKTPLSLLTQGHGRECFSHSGGFAQSRFGFVDTAPK